MILFINYSAEEKNFVASILLKNENGIIPLEPRQISLDHYPNLMRKLIENKTIYVDSYDGYLGIEQTEGPYCESHIFNSEYEGHNRDFPELLLDLDNNIKAGRKSVKKLVKIGESYKNIW